MPTCFPFFVIQTSLTINFLKAFSSDYKRVLSFEMQRQKSLFRWPLLIGLGTAPRPWLRTWLCRSRPSPRPRRPQPCGCSRPSHRAGGPRGDQGDGVLQRSMWLPLPQGRGPVTVTPIQADTRQEQLLSALGELVSPVINPQSQNRASS